MLCCDPYSRVVGFRRNTLDDGYAASYIRTYTRSSRCTPENDVPRMCLVPLRLVFSCTRQPACVRTLVRACVYSIIHICHYIRQQYGVYGYFVFSYVGGLSPHENENKIRKFENSIGLQILNWLYCCLVALSHVSYCECVCPAAVVDTYICMYHKDRWV